MNVEYTGRQYEITPAVRKQVEHGLGKLEKLFGSSFDSHVILTLEKHRHIAEISIKIRNHPIVGIAEATEMSAAVSEALEKIDRQAIKYKSRWRTKKRQPRKKQWAKPAAADAKNVAVGKTAATAVPVVVHAFPPVARFTEAHVVKSADSVAMRPMTLEEAVKECEFRDRDVFVFRDPEGRVKVLHRTKDGKMELIEAP
ncbi:MAG: ribosome-associated translation inhibitor RaiA [Acidobacteria bacterium]|nr:ribosome-associated translation inhibitor RaiA [Acidobacteriota bacterium]MBV9144926.1 ribosome-associated translation inhibitor RaiA [Acidobacteriota bacterium]MBV9437569.1 ribosome-associated translation inhibitor RaiA [Acidobacteriota bacterium]